MATFDKYDHGQFCWVDINSTHQAKAESFYKDLFGWDSFHEEVPQGGHYVMFTQNDKPVAGLGQMSDEMMQAGVPSMWNSYINVDDVDATIAKVEGLGGQVMVPAMDVGQAGRLAFITGPTGASVGLWQAKDHIGSSVANYPGQFSWNELATHDVDAAKGFFLDLVGWSFEDLPMPQIGTYTMIKAGGRNNGGIMPMVGDQWEGIPPHWMVYFAVANCDETVAKAQSLEAKQLVPPTDIPDTGRFSVLQDPTGAHFTVIQLNNPE